MVKAYSYLRFSSRRQAKGDSARRQLELFEDWLARHPEVEGDTSVSDPGVSAYAGKHRLKGALAAFLKKVDDGTVAPGSYFCVETFDRLSREVESEAMHLLTGLTTRGIIVVTLADNEEYHRESTGMDLMRALFVMSRAHGENKERQRKLKATWSEKKVQARNGVKVTSRGPAWLNWNESRQDFDPDPAKSAVVRRIFELAVSGLGGEAIGRLLNAEGVKPFGKSNGWHTEYIITTLKNRAVLGEYQPTNYSIDADHKARRTPDGPPIPNYYPAIIEPELFDRVQAGILARTKGQRRRSGRRGADFPNLFISLARCEECGGTLVIGNRKNSPKVKFLRCYSAHRGHGCSNKSVYQCEPLERDMMAFLAKAQFEKAEPAGEQLRLDTLTVKRAELQTAIENLLDALETSKAAAPRLAQREAELAKLDREAEQLRRTIAVMTKARPSEDIAQRADELWAEMTSAEGVELYAVREQMNAMLLEIFDWLVPTDGGFYAAAGRHGYLFGRDDILTAYSRTGAPMTREVLAAMWSKGFRKGTMKAAA